jgi:hypothetical protein
MTKEKKKYWNRNKYSLVLVLCLIIGAGVSSSNFGKFNTLVVDNLTINGEIILNNTVWNDMLMPLLTGRVGILNPPSLEVFRNGTYAYSFKNAIIGSEEDIMLTLQMEHSYKINSNIYCHMHWSCGTTSNDNVTWGLEYLNANRNGLFLSSGILRATQPCGNAYTNNFIPIGSIGSFSELSGVSLIRVFRNSANDSDTYAGNDVFGLYADCHYEIDSLGSSQELNK